MKKLLLSLFWCLVLFYASGCVLYGSKDPFCTPEESIEDAAFLFPAGTEYFGGWEPDKNHPQSIASSRWMPQERQYRYVLLAKDEKTGKLAAQENKPMLIQYFQHDGFYYADLRFVDPDPDMKELTSLHHLCLVGVLGDRVYFVSYGPRQPGEGKWESCERYDVVKNKEGKPQKIIYKGTPEQLKKMIGTVLQPIFGLCGQLPFRPMPQGKTGIFSPEYREKFLLHHLRLQQAWLRDRGKTGRNEFDDTVRFTEKILNEDGSKKLSPEVLREAGKLLDEQKRMIAEQFKGQ